MIWGVDPGWIAPCSPHLIMNSWNFFVSLRRGKSSAKGYTVDDLPSDLRDYRELAADIVSAYVSHNALSPTDLPKLLTETHNQLRTLATGQVVEPPPKRLTPAVPIGKSITSTAITCLYCGKTFTSIKRHLSADHQASPSDYRATFGLPPDYPMVTSSYSAARSELAKKIGLGTKPKASLNVKKRKRR